MEGRSDSRPYPRPYPQLGRQDPVDEETGALRDLNAKLRGAKPAPGLYLEDLRARLRLAYVEGAEEWTREHVGRGLDKDELERVLGRYEGR